MELVLHTENGDCTVRAHAGDSLARAIWLSPAMEPAPLCGGLGRCGRCRVRFEPDRAPEASDSERRLLGDAELSSGVRLACRHTVEGEGRIELWPCEARRREQPAASPSSGFAPATRLPASAEPERKDGCLLAVDIGTTSVAWRAVDRNGRTIAEGSSLNPQAGAGADVMSRIAVCCEEDGGGQAVDSSGLVQLSLAIRTFLRDVAATLPCRTDIMAVAANTAMTDIFLGYAVSGLARAPYRTSHAGDGWFLVDGLPPVYIPPMPGPFVGGDAAAGLAVLLEQDRAGTGHGLPCVLADLGTNGEFMLLPEEGPVLMASVPLGPALEGIGPACGRLAGPETITRIIPSPLGFTCTTADGRTPSASFTPQGISATGYISLLTALLSAGVLTEEGFFVPESQLSRLSPLARRMARALHRDGNKTRLNLPGGLWLEAGDVEEFLKVRAAFAAVLGLLLEQAHLTAGRLSTIQLAGALGQWCLPQDLEALGFLPAGLAPRTYSLGNSSLDGAVLLGSSPQARERLRHRLAGARLVDASRTPSFHERYISAMRFGV